MKRKLAKGKLAKYLQRKNIRLQKKVKIKNARSRREKYKRKNNKVLNLLNEYKSRRQKFLKHYFGKQKRKNETTTISIVGELGLEKDPTIFLEQASSFIEFDTKCVQFNLEKCTRIWPTGITLLCSFAKWAEMTNVPGTACKISSTDSTTNEVNDYLVHCGFYKFVGRKETTKQSVQYDDKRIVKIQRETNKAKINERENQVINVLEQFSAFTDEQREDFVDNVLTEVFNNVTEHGITFKDDGWWVLAQYHERTKIVSICIADNGIGIKNSLLTGPQLEFIKRELKETDGEGDYMKLAFTKNVSGAITASEIRKSFLGANKVERGARRGQGLKVITDKCAALDVGFSILSRKGYMTLVNNQPQFTSFSKDIFSGTMYHFVIKAREIL